MVKNNMQNDRMFFDHLTNMKDYCGYEPKVLGDGRYVEKE